MKLLLSSFLVFMVGCAGLMQTVGLAPDLEKTGLQASYVIIQAFNETQNPADDLLDIKDRMIQFNAALIQGENPDVDRQQLIHDLTRVVCKSQGVKECDVDPDLGIINNLSRKGIDWTWLIDEYHLETRDKSDRAITLQLRRANRILGDYSQ